MLSTILDGLEVVVAMSGEEFIRSLQGVALLRVYQGADMLKFLFKRVVPLDLLFDLLA